MTAKPKSGIARAVRRDSSTGWIVVVACFVINFLGDGLIFSFGLILVELLATFHQSRAATALIVAITNSAAHITGPLVGAVYDVYGGRIIVVIGTVLSSIGVFASAFAPNIAVLYVTFGIIGGTGIGLMYTPANSCLVKHFTERRALATGIAMSGSGLGTFVMNLLVGYLIEQYSWRGTLIIISALLLNGAACGMVLYEPSYHTDDVNGDQRSEVKETLVKNSGDKSRSFSVVFKKMFDFSLLFDYRCVMFLCSTVSISLAFAVPFSLLPDQVQELGMTENKATWLVSSIGITNGCSRILLGWLGDRRFVNRLVMFESLIFLAGVSLAISPLLTSFEAKMIFTCSFGFFIGGYVMLFPVVLVDTFGAHIIGKTFGMSRFAVAVGSLAALPIAGWIFDSTGSYTIAFVIAGAEFIVGGVCLLIPRLVILLRTKDSRSQTEQCDIETIYVPETHVSSQSN